MQERDPYMEGQPRPDWDDEESYGVMPVYNQTPCRKEKGSDKK